MNILIIMIGVLALLSCRPEYISKNPFEYHSKPAAFFAPQVNQSKMPKHIDRSQYKRLVNDAYPIEVVLFKDGRFHYHLENLGDGHGTWRHQGGRLELYAERDLFVMKMNIHSIDEHQGSLVMDFVDRFGTQYLPLDIKEP